jgi:hypothetical protein
VDGSVVDALDADDCQNDVGAERECPTVRYVLQRTCAVSFKIIFETMKLCRLHRIAES